MPKVKADFYLTGDEVDLDSITLSDSALKMGTRGHGMSQKQEAGL